MSNWSVVAVASTIGVVLGALGIMTYDAIRFVLGHYDE